MNISTFSAFKSRNFRLFFAGQSVSLIGTWMQKTAVSWIIYSVTHSKFMLGVSLFASVFPSFLFSFMGGLASDLYNRYRLLVLTQVLSMVQALLLTVLVFFKPDDVWGIIWLSAVLGVINAFDVPARQSLVYQMVDDKRDLPNALALNSSMVNLSRLIGPGIAGIIIERFGETACFGLNTLSFVAVIISLLMMKLPVYVPKVRTGSMARELKEGFNYLIKTPEIGFVILMLGLISLFALPFATLIPVYAKDIFKGTAATFGVIDSAIGLGAFVGAIFLASLKSGSNLNRILVINTFVFGLGLVLFSHTTYYPLALLFVTISAFGMMSQITLSNTLIQLEVDHAMRGRVISFFAMAFFGMQPLGGLIVGSLSQHIGVENTVMAEGIITILIALWRMRFLQRHKPVQKIKSAVVQPVEAIIEA